MGMCKWIFKDATKKKLQKNLWEQKFWNFKSEIIKITFPTIWRCAGDFLKVLLKFKMAAKTQKVSFVNFF